MPDFPDLLSASPSPVARFERQKGMRMTGIAPTCTAMIRPAADRGGEETERRATPVGRMIDRLVRDRPRTAAHALYILRTAFAHYPLALRLAALAATMKDPTF
jgi:hypothetical protein